MVGGSYSCCLETRSPLPLLCQGSGCPSAAEASENPWKLSCQLSKER